MLRNGPDAGAPVLRRLIERSREDVGFHDLLRTDIRAALTDVGITVPHGVKVGYAPNAAAALSMMLDHSTRGTEGAATLDDNALEAVVGGGDAYPDMEQISSFLRTLRYGQT